MIAPRIFGSLLLLALASACGDDAIHKRRAQPSASPSSAAASASASSAPAAPLHPEHAKLEIVRLADDVEAWGTPPAELPVGGTLLQETVPMGSTKQEVPKDVVSKVCVAPVHCDKDGDKTVVELPLGATHSYLRVVTQPDESVDGTAERATAYLKTLHLPDGVRPLLGHVFEVDDATKVSRPIAVRSYFVRGESAITERDIADALAKTDGPASVALKLSPEGAKRFEALTRDTVKRRLAVVVDGYVLTAPVVETPIAGGSLAIPLGTTEKATPQELEEAGALAKALRPPH